MEEMRKILEAINMEVCGIMADWSDPRSECREILRLTAQALALSSPQPEAREEDIEMDELLQVCADYCRLGTDGHLHMQRTPIEQALKAYASRLADPRSVVHCIRCGDPIRVGVCENCAPEIDARLAAPKPEGRVIPLELLSSMFEALYYRREITETHLAAMRMIAGDYGFFISEPCPAEEPAPAPTVGDAIQASESNSPETPDGSPRDCDTCRWEGRSLLCCDCRDRAHWQPVPGQSEDIPSPMTRAEIGIAMQDQCKETQALRSKLARKDEALMLLNEGLRLVRESALDRLRMDDEIVSIVDYHCDKADAALREPDGRKGE